MNNPNHRRLLVEHADLDGDACPVDDICDSIPKIVEHITYQDHTLRENKQEIQKLKAQLAEAERKLKNVRTQRNRLEKRKGKTLYN
jgi:septal ring factor EnvC (AmiA/AmiB activator)